MLTLFVEPREETTQQNSEVSKMALTATNTHHLSGNVLVDALAWVGRAFVALGENSARAKRLDYLNSLSDEQLAAKGIQRQDIVRHVFADVLYL